MSVIRRKHVWLASMTALLALSAWGEPGVAASPKRAECIKAHEKAQELRRAGELRAAKKKLVFCAQDQCPDLIKADCGQWLGEVSESMPTVVIVAKDADGNEVTDARVLFDGREIAKRLTGRAVQVDPGQHKFTVERPNGQHIAQNVVINQGEKNRVLTIRFPAAPVAPRHGATSTGPETGTGAPSSTPEEHHGGKAGAFVLGGVGLVAIGAFAYLGATTSKDVSNMRSSCAPTCDQSRVDADKTKALLADVSLGVGIVALGAATYLFLSHPSSKPTARVTLPVDVRAVRGGALAAYGTTF